MKWPNKKLLRTIFNYSVLSGLFFLLGFFFRYQLPKIESWVLVEVESLSAQHGPVRVWPQKLNVTFFPIGFEASKIRIIPKDEFKKVLSPTFIEKVEVSLSFWSLLAGKVRVSNISIDGIHLALFIKDKPKVSDNVVKFTQQEFNQNLKEVFRVPVDQVEINRFNLIAEIEPSKLAVKINDFSATFQNRYNALLANISSPEILIKQIGDPRIVTTSINAKVLIDESQLQVSALKIKRSDSYIISSGGVQGRFVEGDFENINLDIRGRIDFVKFSETLHRFFPQHASLKLGGTTNFEAKLLRQSDKPWSSDFRLQSQNLKINQYDIGNIDTAGKVENQKLTLSKAIIKNKAGMVSVPTLEMVFGDNWELKSKLKVDNVEVRQLLLSLGIGSTPLTVKFSGEIDCNGQLKPSFNLVCQNGIVEIPKIWVHSGEPSRTTIVDLEGVSLKGGLTIDQEKVSYRSDIKIREFSGLSSGVISYKNGFKISYDTDLFDLKSVKDISGLNLLGRGSIHGTTQGNSQTAKLSMNVNVKDVWLSDFGLGNVKAQISYNQGFLKVSQIRGLLDTTQYTADTSINLKKELIYLTAKTPYYNAKDLLYGFSKKTNFPIQLTGTGQAEVKAWGPLELGRLSYDLKMDLFRGTFYQESFDSVKGHLHSRDGEVQLIGTEVKKSKSTIGVSGTADPKGNINILFDGHNFFVEESENLKKLGVSLNGQIDFKTRLTGFVLTPDIGIDAKLYNSFIGEKNVNDSFVSLFINKKQLLSNGNIVGKTIEFNLAYPFDPSEKFDFILRSKQWDFIKFFALFSKNAEKKGYESNLNLDINLHADTGGIWNSSGYIRVPEGHLKRGILALSTRSPLEATIENGLIKTNNFAVYGDNSYLELISRQTSRGIMDLELSGKLPLGLLAVLTPLKEIGGNLSISLKSNGPIDDVKILGSAFVENGMAVIQGLPHPIENASVDVLFNKNTIVLNALNGNIAGGTLKSNGNITIEGYKNVPIDLNVDIKNAKLDIPSGVQTVGEAKIKINGTWLPYTLSGQYDVESGLVSMSFNDSNKKEKEVVPSHYLPNFLNNSPSDPINLNLSVNIENPIDVKNDEIEAKVSGNIAVNGTPSAPRLTGRIKTEKNGKISFRENEFELLTGNLTYENQVPDNPKLYVSAKTEINSQDITYDVELLVQGNAKKPTIQMTSTPPLKEMEIVSLLALGITSSELDGGIGANEQAAQTSYQIGSALLTSPLGKELKNRFGVDVQISSGFDDEKKSVPTVTLKKKLTKKLSAEASRTIEENPKNNVKMKYDINQNLSVIGLWDSTEINAADTEKNNSENKVGVDLEYRIRFK